MTERCAHVLCVDVPAVAGWVALLEAERHAVARATLDAEVLADFIPDVIVFGRPVQADDIKSIRAERPAASIVALCSEATSEAIEAGILAGVDHVVPASVGDEAIAAVIRRGWAKPRYADVAERVQRTAATDLELSRFEGIVGSHPTMIRLLRRVAQVARSRATVLIYGETGTGKELIAGALHANSRRAGGPFVKLNCAALNAAILESELFGHERGAFTGAAVRRIGRFEQADGGTLFLDEISEISMELQVKLLRFLQEKEFERVGSNETRAVDVRVVAATNKDLLALVRDGHFREDLYYRLHVVRLDVPPLRTRPSDILLLAERFLQELAEENEREIEGFTEKAREALLAHPWPGNVRALRNAVETAVVLCEGTRIDTADLPLEAPGDRGEASNLELMVPGISLAELERWAILKTLEATGNVQRAAEILGVSRRTIQYRLGEWGVSAKELRRG